MSVWVKGNAPKDKWKPNPAACVEPATARAPINASGTRSANAPERASVPREQRRTSLVATVERVNVSAMTNASGSLLTSVRTKAAAHRETQKNKTAVNVERKCGVAKTPANGPNSAPAKIKVSVNRDNPWPVDRAVPSIVRIVVNGTHANPTTACATMTTRAHRTAATSQPVANF